MDYEKKYNEALERAREIKSKILSSHLSTESCKAVSEYIDTIIPELNESEEERIINQLITLVNSTGEVLLIQTNKEELIAYLERQKEQRPVQSEEEKEYIRTLKSRIADFLRGKDKDEVDTTYYQRICDWLDGRHVEQKPVEIHIDNPNIQKVDPDVKISTSDSSAGGDELLYVSNKSYNIGYRDGVASVKPSWKPSKEQMCYLKKVYESYDFCDGERDALEALYNDLKKLM